MLLTDPIASCTAFNGARLIASGPPLEVLQKARHVIDVDEHAQVLIFDDCTGHLIDVDSLPAPPHPTPHPTEPETKRPGRPKLGVVAREITLLPRHWEWLATQPGGASVAIRKLVEHAIKANREKDAVRRAQEATYRFVSAMAGDNPGYEEAIRALFAGQQARFLEFINPWPVDVRDHAIKLAASAFPE